MLLKRCVLCERFMTLRHFNRNATKSDGLQSHCRECGRVSSATYYRNNSTKHKQVASTNRDVVRRNNQRQLFALLLRSACSDCGERDPLVLEFDHTGKKKATISRMIANGHSWARILEEIGNTQILCANCHRRKTSRQQRHFRWHLNRARQRRAARIRKARSTKRTRRRMRSSGIF